MPRRFPWGRLFRLMRILFDHGTPSGIARSLAGHKVTEALERGWERISNGELLTKAEAAGFELLLTTDKNIRYQQNLKGRKIAIVVLGNSAWRMARKHLDRIAAAVNAATPGSYARWIFRFIKTLSSGLRTAKGLFAAQRLNQVPAVSVSAGWRERAQGRTALAE